MVNQGKRRRTPTKQRDRPTTERIASLDGRSAFIAPGASSCNKESIHGTRGRRWVVRRWVGRGGKSRNDGTTVGVCRVFWFRIVMVANAVFGPLKVCKEQVVALFRLHSSSEAFHVYLKKGKNTPREPAVHVSPPDTRCCGSQYVAKAPQKNMSQSKSHHAFWWTIQVRMVECWIRKL